MSGTFGRRRGRFTGIIGGVVVAALALTACGGSSSNSSSTGSSGAAGATGGSLTIGENSAPTTFDPWTNQNAYEVLDAVYDTLIHVDKDGKLQPWLATSWTFTDPTTLQLKLQTGVTFNDGTAFDADAVKANLEYGRDTDKGNGGQVFLKNVTSVDVVDASTVNIKLAQPNPAFPADLSQFNGYMVSPKALANPESLTTTPAGTGPYVVDTAASRTSLTYAFDRNPNYWAASKNLYPFDKVTFKIIGDPTAAQNAAKTGQLDALSLIGTPSDIPGFTTVNSQSGQFSGFTGLAVQDLNGNVAPQLKDVRVRQAMNYAIDRDAIKTALFGDAALTVPSVPYQPDGAGWSDELANYYSHDVAKAKELLAEAGYPNGFDLKALSLPVADPLAQVIAGNLREVGINLQIESHTTDLVQQVFSGTWPTNMILSRLTGDPGQDITALMTPAAFYNIQKYSDPKIDEFLAQAAAAPDEASRNKIYADLGVYAAEQAWFVAPVIQLTVTAYNPKTVSVTPPPFGQIPLYMYQLPA